MDLIEEITSTSAVAQCFLLDASAHLIRGDTGEINSMKGVAGAGDVLERVIDSIRLFLIQFQHREMDTNTELPTALIRPISTDHVGRVAPDPTSGMCDGPHRAAGPQYR